ncbi:MAG: hypothetical protein KAR20_12985, partial [Candidatus Heimdallarchaeota archaeon]|nr:hypothetical protein [Candidatus Heimdallarchaeota archaeon]
DLLHGEPSNHSNPYLASDYWTTKFSDGIIDHEALVNTGFSGVFMLLNAYFWTAYFVSSVKITNNYLIGFSMAGMLTCAAFSSKPKKKSSVYNYFALSFLTYSIYLIFNSSLFISHPIFFTPLALGLFFIIVRYATREAPYSALIQNLQNLAVLSVFVGIFLGLVETPLYLLLVALCVQFTLRRSYNNLLFRTTLPMAAFYASYYYLRLLLIPIYPSLSSAVFILLLLEWRLVSRDIRWHKSILRPILGFASFGAALNTYTAYLITYPAILLYITPVVLLIAHIVLFKLRKVPELAHRVPFYTGLIFLNSMLTTFALGRIYFFVTLTNPYLASVFLTIAVNEFLYLFYFDKFEIPMKSVPVLGILVAGSISLAGLVYL